MIVLAYTVFIVALVACVWMAWDVCRQCERAQHDLDVDLLWDDEDEWEAAA